MCHVKQEHSVLLDMISSIRHLEMPSILSIDLHKKQHTKNQHFHKS